jgi:hypothetical protein
MTTSELIAALREADPSGNLPVWSGGDVLFAEVQPAYYDGCLQLMVREKRADGFHNVTGAKVVSSGQKVRLHSMGVEGLLLNDPEAPVDLSGLSPQARARWEGFVSQWRAESREAVTP